MTRESLLVELGLIGHFGPTIFADGDLDALLRKAFAEFGAFNHTGKLLG